MEPRKQKEIEYYDKKAEDFSKPPSEKRHGGDFEGFSPFILGSYEFLQNFLKNKLQ